MSVESVCSNPSKGHKIIDGRCGYCEIEKNDMFRAKQKANGLIGSKKIMMTKKLLSSVRPLSSEETIIQIVEDLTLEKMPFKMTKKQKAEKDTNEFTLFDDVTKHIIVKGSDNRILIHSVPSSPEIEFILVFVEKVWEKVWRAYSNIPPENGNRGFYWVLHICCWRKYSDVPFMSAHFQLHNSIIKEFIRVMKPICNYIEALLKEYFPEEFSILNAIKLPNECFKPGGIYPGFAMNKEVGTIPHIDSGDLKHGLCAVISFGEFVGGDLCMFETKTVFPFLRGQIIIFRSTNLHHWNKQYTGNRNSIVLFCDNNVQTWSNGTAPCLTKGKTHRRKRKR
eukprot:TRINITY_DN8434_c0_g1_i1.p1 TRINITY_DN8434_c0_g1~~TRINITY_DN8434_c0_g1_i1.p1  ORF type:complete len:337 (-),score=32.69 TRINITY_DN8434_c0_g1_i1:7-1017(-)